MDFREAAELKNSALFVPSLATYEVVEGKRTVPSLTDVQHSGGRDGGHCYVFGGQC